MTNILLAAILLALIVFSVLQLRHNKHTEQQLDALGDMLGDMLRELIDVEKNK